MYESGPNSCYLECNFPMTNKTNTKIPRWLGRILRILGIGATGYFVIKQILFEMAGDLLSDLIQGFIKGIVSWLKAPTIIRDLALISIAAGLSYIISRAFSQFLPKELRHNKKLRAVITLNIGLVAFILLGGTTLAIAYSSLLKPKTDAQTPPTPSPTPEPTEVIYRECLLIIDEWPCLYEVKRTTPRESIYSIVKRAYHIEGTVDPEIFRYVCDANRELLVPQFYKNIPQADRGDWDQDPCNYLVPGNVLVIPILPEELIGAATEQ